MHEILYEYNSVIYLETTTTCRGSLMRIPIISTAMVTYAMTTSYLTK